MALPDRSTTQRHTLRVVVLSQIFGGAGLAAGITVGALLAEEMLGSQSLAGVPSALFTLGAALTAFLIGRATENWGRRVSLGSGFLIGGLGAFAVVLSAILASPVLLFIALFIYGAGSATNMQARYAGADLALPSKRGSAISLAMVSTTLGAVAGPNLVTPMGNFAMTLGIPSLAGPFLLAGSAYLVAGLILILFLRPDPYLLAKKLDVRSSAQLAPSAGVHSTLSRGVLVGATVMLISQVTMVAVMTMTPVQMYGSGQTLGAVGLVIGLHIGAMYLPSPLTGWLVDRLGRRTLVVLASLTLGLAGLLAAFSPGGSLPWLGGALILLGLGWNFGFISSTTLIVDSTTTDERPRIQGTIDVLISLSAAAAGALSGVVVGVSSYRTLGILCAALALALIPFISWFWKAGLCPLTDPRKQKNLTVRT